MTVDDQEQGASVVVYENGPLLLRGSFTLRTPDGETIDPGRTTVALCRCGRSAIKPFCDGTHKAVKFRAGVDRETPAPRSADAGQEAVPHPKST
ncbi:CDGSH iron-sulfur domain-containing protein [Actinoplanes sp. NEAU-A12]|uniref:CDGSH iron-sulfur domain-containing protein n=1 Tax=Actinoplanes sandaracinus TaxID=3045177 RepID=A0ABT6WI10_9ACTN|nr:CDGSH iron-sulfur domain-containing protein [Actinoplanes sandaracinus]MDI6099355.1 CDGSH iron-sulfur domain-containing protein [Actinoplanes sandaracinus]